MIVITGFTLMGPNVTAQNQAPVADANGPYSSYVGVEVTLDASGSSDPDVGDTLEYYWDFDNDGTWDTGPSTNPIEKHTWNNVYQGEIVLWVTDGELNDTASTNVSISKLEVDAGDDMEVNEGEEVEISGEFSPIIPIDIIGIWEYDPPDIVPPDYWPPPPPNTTYCKNPPILVLDKVTYGSVKLECTLIPNDFIVKDLQLKALNGIMTDVDIGCSHDLDYSTPTSFKCTFNPLLSDPDTCKVTITMEPDSDDIWRIQWHISGVNGDLSFGVFTNRSGIPLPFYKKPPDDCNKPCHVWLLSIWHNNILIGWDIVNLTVNNVPPTVDSGSDQTVSSGDVVQFNGSFSDPSWLDTHTIVWDFGDGTTSSGNLTPTHKYDEGGKYTVTFTVTDDDGGSSTDTMTVTVKEDEDTDWPILLLAVLVFIIIIILIVLMMAKKKSTANVEKKDKGSVK
jgi:PKD repeat protein